MQGQTLENIMRTTMTELKQMVDVNTIVGDAVETVYGSVIIPVSNVSFGFVSGGGEYGEVEYDTSGNSPAGEYPFAGGSGAGVSVNPVAFLVVDERDVKLLPVSYPCTLDRVIEMAPKLLDSIKSMFKGEEEQCVKIRKAKSHHLEAEAF
ncbi:MAG: GerW family sporulation protein [Christensenellales bacterium]